MGQLYVRTGGDSPMKNRSLTYKIIMYIILIVLTCFTLMPLLW